MSPVEMRRERMLSQLERLPATDRKRIVKLLGHEERQLLRRAMRERSKAGAGVAKGRGGKAQSPYSPWLVKHLATVGAGEGIGKAAGMTDEARELLLKVSGDVEGQILPLKQDPKHTGGAHAGVERQIGGSVR